MAIVNSAHLLEQARRLLETKNSRGQVRQADRRRAISAAYYAVFHSVLAAVADEFVGVAARKNPRYALAYRSLDHKSLEDLCRIAQRIQPPDTRSRYAKYVPEANFDQHIREFASLALDLKEKRNVADYDPIPWIKLADASKAIDSATSAIEGFARANATHRKIFLTLLAFPPR